jgi:hypothetical protein
MDELRSLREHVQTVGPLGVLEAVGWITRAAKTLAIIHKEKRVHGAINADAILITAGDCSAEGILLHPDDVPEVPEYHSRKRASGGGATRSDDVWALCVTLFYSLTGAQPFPRGVLTWLKADKRQPPPIAVHGADLAIMEVILGRLLDPRATKNIPPANVLVLQLRGLSPRAGELPPLPLREPRDSVPAAAEVPGPPILPEIRVGEISVLTPEINGSTPPPSEALLASLPPAPLKPRSTRPRGLMIAILVVLAITAGALLAWWL